MMERLSTHSTSDRAEGSADCALDRAASMRRPRPSACLWCGRPFSPRRGGKRQRFCLPEHRRAFEAAARQYVGHLIAMGELSIGALHTAPATRAFLPGAIHYSAATTLAGTAQSRSISPIRIVWAGAVDLAMDRARRPYDRRADLAENGIFD
jgi:hypothetical protein